MTGSLGVRGVGSCLARVAYDYDGAGNLVGTSAGDAYSYDPWGYLVEATVDGTTTTAAFDATGARVVVDGVSQLHDRVGLDRLISTGDGQSFVHSPGGGVMRDGQDWLLRDAVGSVRHVTDTSGAVTGSADFTVFGEPLNTPTGVFGFAGEQTDPNGLVHLRARGYNPALGIFTSYDPLQPGAPSTAGWNHYSYAANNPTSWSDPSGRGALTGEYGALVQRAAFAGLGGAMGGIISLFTCQNDGPSWTPAIRDLDGGCIWAEVITGVVSGALFGPAVLASAGWRRVASVCGIGLADGAIGHGAHAAFTDRDADDWTAALTDMGVGCVFAVLTFGLGRAWGRFRPNTPGKPSAPDPTVTNDGNGGPGNDGGSSPSRGDDNPGDGPGCTGAQCDVPCSDTRCGPFVDGDLFETTVEINGRRVPVAGEVTIDGSQLTLSDVTVFADGGDAVNEIGARAFMGAIQEVGQQAADAGFDTMRITGTRVPTSSSANPGHDIDFTIDLGRFRD